MRVVVLSCDGHRLLTEFCHVIHFVATLRISKQYLCLIFLCRFFLWRGDTLISATTLILGQAPRGYLFAFSKGFLLSADSQPVN